MSHGSEKRARTKHLTIRLTPEERAAIDQAADRAGLTPGSYARQAVLGAPAPRQVRKPPVERQELARLLGELGRVGNNLNQLARAANTGNGVDGVAHAEALGGLKTACHAILVALGRA
ncbi:MAG: plasmid mobilization protein [Alphaproteobacteria bacterium]